MSTVSGLFPNAITPSQVAPNDPAQQAVLRREAETAIFPPVGETEAVSRNQNRATERPARQDSQKDAPSTVRRETAPAEDQNSEPEARLEGRNQGEPENEPARQEREQAEQAKQQRDIELIRELAQRDREVRAHEQAHMAVGGQYAGPMSLVFERGPDGRRYAVAGEVAIDTSPIPNNPQATVLKADQIRRAALAPAEPSTQDRKVAAQAIQMKLQAQVEVQREQRSERENEAENRTENRETTESSSENRREQQAESNRSDESTRDRINDLLDKTREASERILVLDQYRSKGPSVGTNLDFSV